MNLRYFKNIIPVAAVAFAVAGLSSCTKDLDVTPIDPSSTMTPSEPELFTKCYATMALSGNYGGDSNDCDIDRLDGGTTGFVRQLWNSNELTTDEAICAWGFTIASIPVLPSATTIWKSALVRMLPVRLRFVSSAPCITIT